MFLSRINCFWSCDIYVDQCPLYLRVYHTVYSNLWLWLVDQSWVWPWLVDHRIPHCGLGLLTNLAEVTLACWSHKYSFKRCVLWTLTHKSCRWPWLVDHLIFLTTLVLWYKCNLGLWATLSLLERPWLVDHFLMCTCTKYTKLLLESVSLILEFWQAVPQVLYPWLVGYCPYF